MAHGQTSAERPGRTGAARSAETVHVGEPPTGELPGTLRRSSREAQETFARARESAVQTYGEEDQANRVAHAELKHRFEKRGDHWIAKEPAGPAD
ncbi:MAG: ChaB family protein [Streptosporangiaceae bacterium]